MRGLVEGEGRFRKDLEDFMGELYEMGREERWERVGGRWREYVVQLVAYGGEREQRLWQSLRGGVRDATLSECGGVEQENQERICKRVEGVDGPGEN